MVVEAVEMEVEVRERRERRKERHRGRKGAMLKPERFDWIRSRLSDFVMYKKSK